MALDLVLLLSFHQFKSGNSFRNGWKDKTASRRFKKCELWESAEDSKHWHVGQPQRRSRDKPLERAKGAGTQHKGTEQRRGEDGAGTRVSCCRERLKDAGGLGGREKGWPSHQDVVLLSEIEG